jgi:hypothetical protein
MTKYSAVESLAKEFIKFVKQEKKQGNPIPVTSHEVADFFATTHHNEWESTILKDPRVEMKPNGIIKSQGLYDKVRYELTDKVAKKAKEIYTN